MGIGHDRISQCGRASHNTLELNPLQIALEGDGDSVYHTRTNFEADMNRQAVLERIGWQFIRIRSSQFIRAE